MPGLSSYSKSSTPFRQVFSASHLFESTRTLDTHRHANKYFLFEELLDVYSGSKTHGWHPGLHASLHHPSQIQQPSLLLRALLSYSELSSTWLVCNLFPYPKGDKGNRHSKRLLRTMFDLPLEEGVKGCEFMVEQTPCFWNKNQLQPTEQLTIP